MMDLAIFGGRSNKRLASEICVQLHYPLGDILITDFSDGETFVQIKENIRGKDVFFIQSTCYPANTNLMELLIMVDAARRSSAGRITAVIPYFGYGRQDRKDRPRVPITAKLVSDMITQAGVDRVLSLDMHTGQLQGFFNIPVDHLTSAPLFIKILRDLKLRNAIIVSPDAGSTERASAYAKHLDVPLAIIDKRRDREANNASKAMRVVGDVLGKTAVIIDDMIDTAGTLVNGANALMEEGAEEVYAVATHGVFSGPAFERIEHSPIKRVLVTETIPQREPMVSCFRKIHYYSVARLLAEAISRIHNGDSVSSLLDIALLPLD